MTDLMPATRKPSPVAGILRDLGKGLAIGLGLYVVWVVLHAVLFGLAG